MFRLKCFKKDFTMTSGQKITLDKNHFDELVEKDIQVRCACAARLRAGTGPCASRRSAHMMNIEVL